VRVACVGNCNFVGGEWAAACLLEAERCGVGAVIIGDSGARRIMLPATERSMESVVAVLVGPLLTLGLITLPETISESINIKTGREGRELQEVQLLM
jgi:hypothetical protein